MHGCVVDLANLCLPAREGKDKAQRKSLFHQALRVKEVLNEICNVVKQL